MSVDINQQIEISKEREAKRMKAEPFKTMKPVSPETAEELRGWREPKHAYVLFETNIWRLDRQEWGHSTFTLNVEARPEQTQKIHDYVMKKKFRVIHYGNFPTLDHPNAARRALALLHAGKDKINPWDELAQHCRTYMNLVPNAPQVIDVLEKKLAEAEARAAAAEAKLKGDHGKGNTNSKGSAGANQAAA